MLSSLCRLGYGNRREGRGVGEVQLVQTSALVKSTQEHHPSFIALRRFAFHSPSTLPPTDAHQRRNHNLKHDVAKMTLSRVGVSKSRVQRHCPLKLHPSRLLPGPRSTLASRDILWERSSITRIMMAFPPITAFTVQYHCSFP